MIRRQPHLPMLGQRREQKYSFHPGESLTNTAPRTTTKRKVGELRSRLSHLWGPSLRIKLQRFREITWIAVHNILAHQHQGFPGDHVSANLEVVQRHSAEGPCRRIEPH